MKILILTSSDHIYANYILKQLIFDGLFNKHNLIILEQDSIIPKKSKINGLLKYIKVSGWRYVFFQLSKNYLFLISRSIAAITNNYNSSFFPYYKNDLKHFSRYHLNNLHLSDNQLYIKKMKPQIIISVLSKEIIPKEILKIPPLGCINIHPAFLPFYRGVSPTFWSLVNNEEFSGVTLHYIDEKIDTGNIILRKKIPILDYETEHSLYMACSKEGVNMLKEFLIQVISNPNQKIKTLINPKKGSYFSLPTKIAVNNFLFKYSFFNLKEFIIPKN